MELSDYQRTCNYLSLGYHALGKRGYSGEHLEGSPASRGLWLASVAVRILTPSETRGSHQSFIYLSRRLLTTRAKYGPDDINTDLSSTLEFSSAS